MDAPGTYPIKLERKSWHLDKQRKQPVLRVSRLQLPVGPDYAITAYSLQGLALDSTIVDLCFDERTDTATAYVALSRVRTRNDILIMHSFILHPFQKVIPIGPKLVLKNLRGEDIADGIAEHLAVCRPASCHT